MHATATRRTLPPDTTGTKALAADRQRTPPRTPHRWVGAALLDLGLGATDRAEHAARTGRHTIRSSTRIEVLEVYCGRCRVPYTEDACWQPCRTVTAYAG